MGYGFSEPAAAPAAGFSSQQISSPQLLHPAVRFPPPPGGGRVSAAALREAAAEAARVAQSEGRIDAAALQVRDQALSAEARDPAGVYCNLFIVIFVTAFFIMIIKYRFIILIITTLWSRLDLMAVLLQLGWGGGVGGAQALKGGVAVAPGVRCAISVGIGGHEYLPHLTCS